RNVSDVCKYLTYNVLTDLCYGESLDLFRSPTMRWLPKAVIPYSRMIVMVSSLICTPANGKTNRLIQVVQDLAAPSLYLKRWDRLLFTPHLKEIYRLGEWEVRSRFKTGDEIRTGPNLSDCRFLLSCVKESMRLSPPVVHGPPRRVQAGGVVVDGEYFAEGTVVSTPTYTLHRSGKNFDAPDIFKPERWMTEGEELKRARQAYQPVSLARLLFTYDLRLPPNASCCNKAPRGERCQLEMKGWMTSHVGGPQVQFRRRSVHGDNEDMNAQSTQ
ncbi:hypothetical protein D0869_16295, partial [Hortaea werneckii]